MKQPLFLFFTLLTMAACMGGKVEVIEIDTLSTDTDTVITDPKVQEEAIIAQTPVPKSADGVFYDFVASFCQNSTYQKSRIRFPLPCMINNEEQTVTEDDWAFSHLHYHYDIYTVFFSDTESLELETDPKVTQVRVLWYEIDKSMARDYHFEKIDDQWMLTSLNQHALSDDPDYEFVSFLASFVSDSDFQTEHLAETITYDGLDPDYEDEFDVPHVKDLQVPASRWDDLLIPELPTDQISNIDFGQPLSDHERIVSIEAPATDFNCRLHFHKRGDIWELHKVENY